MVVEKAAKFWSASPNSSNPIFPPFSTPNQNLPFTKMYTLNTVDSFQIPGPKDTYIYDIVSVAGGLAAISSDDSLRLFDPLALSGAPLNSIRQVNTDVTCLKAIDSLTEADALIVCTAGRDGKVCLLDPRSGARIGEVRTGGLLLGLSLACAFASVHSTRIYRILYVCTFSVFVVLLHRISHVICQVEYKYPLLPWSRLWN